ncbi:MAG: hypothetical protein PHY28_05360 [Dehalococcoidales bacterium]|nr:hypothetical protein [Dehalococcoidales bacterium]
MNIAMGLVGCVIWLIIVFAIGAVTDPIIQTAVDSATGLEKPILLVLQFIMTNPIGELLEWIAGCFLIIGVSLKSE